MDEKNYGREMPSSSRLELSAWIFMRISGVVLVLMALGHLVIMHIINNVDIIDYDFVVARWASPFWRAYDLILLLLALLHGVNGARTVLDDYVHSPVKRRYSFGILYILGILLTIAGTITVIAFQPQ
jgi:succinate dehydrogenase / fumarate reductase membrane anchor subunit